MENKLHPLKIPKIGNYLSIFAWFEESAQLTPVQDAISLEEVKQLIYIRYVFLYENYKCCKAYISGITTAI